jgi:hypothetical protein
MALLDADLAFHLLKQERVLWSGCPQDGSLLTRSDIGLFPIGIVIFAIGLWSTFGDDIAQGDALRWIVGPMFLFGGLYMLVGRFLQLAWLRSRTIYVVTDQRVIRLQRAFRTCVRALDFGYLPRLELNRRTASIDFERDPLIHPDTGAVLEESFFTVSTSPLRFENIRDSERVYLLIRQLDAARRAEILKNH